MQIISDSKEALYIIQKPLKKSKFLQSIYSLLEKAE